MRAKYFAPIYGFEMMQRLARAKVEEGLSKADKQEDGARENMMDAMARPDSTRGQEKLSKEEMVADGCLMIAAGTDTTANALGNILWHVTQDKEIEKRLLKELRARMGKEEDVESAS
jgi:cytochrome P450